MFIRRKIDLTFIKGSGTFSESGTNTLKVSGLRVQVSITGVGGDSQGNANVRVYGLTPSMLNQLSAFNMVDKNALVQLSNQIIIEAGDDVNGMFKIFQGYITISRLDMSMPESSLVVVSFAGAYDAINPVPPTSYPGSVDAAVIMSNFAAMGGYKFEQNGVSVMLNKPYFKGTMRDQAMSCADQANIEWVIENGIMAIWNKGSARGATIPLISPTSGLIGYPSFADIGIAVKSIFNPKIFYGYAVQLQSSLQNANGTWYVFHLAHDLESETPNGRWFTNFIGSPNAQ